MRDFLRIFCDGCRIESGENNHQPVLMPRKNCKNRKRALAISTANRYQTSTMKKLLFTLTLAAFACAAALQASEDKKSDKAADATKAKVACADQAKACCPSAAKTACCEKEAFTKRITLSPKRTELAQK